MEPALLLKFLSVPTEPSGGPLFRLGSVRGLLNESFELSSSHRMFSEREILGDPYKALGFVRAPILFRHGTALEEAARSQGHQLKPDAAPQF